MENCPRCGSKLDGNEGWLAVSVVRNGVGDGKQLPLYYSIEDYVYKDGKYRFLDIADGYAEGPFLTPEEPVGSIMACCSECNCEDFTADQFELASDKKVHDKVVVRYYERKNR
jgi:hypothetical protein